MGVGPGQRSWRPPVDDVVAQVPLEHEAPAPDGVEEGLPEGAAVTLQPAVEHLGVVALGYLFIQLLVGVDLGGKGPLSCRAAAVGSAQRVAARQALTTRSFPSPGPSRQPLRPRSLPPNAGYRLSERDATWRGQQGFCRRARLKLQGVQGVPGATGHPQLSRLCAAACPRGFQDWQPAVRPHRVVGETVSLTPPHPPCGWATLTKLQEKT